MAYCWAGDKPVNVRYGGACYDIFEKINHVIWTLHSINGLVQGCGNLP